MIIYKTLYVNNALPGISMYVLFKYCLMNYPAYNLNENWYSVLCKTNSTFDKNNMPM